MRKLPPIRLSGYSAIIFGKESEQAQEKRNEKSEADLPKKVYPAIRLFEYNPRLSVSLFVCIKSCGKFHESTQVYKKIRDLALNIIVADEGF